MGKLSDLVKAEKRIALTGPYGTQVAERVAQDITTRPQMVAGVLNLKYLGAGCSALLTPEGQAYLSDIAREYIRSVPPSQPLAVVTPSFRLAKQVLEAAAMVRGVDPRLPALGLELCLDSVVLADTAIQASERSRDTTLLTMSVGTPFDCYKGEETPRDVEGKYFPQVFAAVRFCNQLDYLMFETVPSLNAAIGAARTFTAAHKSFDVAEKTGSFKLTGTILYLGNLLSAWERAGDDVISRFAPSYDGDARVFWELQPEKEYVISLCLERDGTLNGKKLNDAVTALYETIDHEHLTAPAGIGINCNSPAVTERALRSLSSENRRRVIGIHPNASSECDPRRYERMTKRQAISPETFAHRVAELVTRYHLTIYGGCCGTDAETMKKMHQALNPSL